MQRMQFLDGLEFQKQPPRDDEIHAVAAVQLRAFVDER
jgi:hypothetical protein